MDYANARNNTLKYYAQKASNFRSSNLVFWQYEMEDFNTYLKAGKVLEIGCGAGVEAAILGEWYDYLGIDVTPEFVEISRQANPGLKFEVCDLFDLSKLDETFDGFWCAATLLHIPTIEIVKALQSIRSVLSSQAIGFISVKEGEGEKLVVYEGEEEYPPRLFKYWNRFEFSKVLRKSGFEVIEFTQKSTGSRLDSGKHEFWLGFFVQTID
jgi:SAM-dependent methyltransferase